jgi:hypothetical protein
MRQIVSGFAHYQAMLMRKKLLFSRATSIRRDFPGYSRPQSVTD